MNGDVNQISSYDDGEEDESSGESDSEEKTAADGNVILNELYMLMICIFKFLYN